jgi:hypothetical protein
MEKKIFVFKYALTKGIIEVDAEIKQGIYGEFTKVKNQGNLIYLDKDYVHTKEEALKKAEDMRLKKIESLKKQIVKLEKMKF